MKPRVLAVGALALALGCGRKPAGGAADLDGGQSVAPAAPATASASGATAELPAPSPIAPLEARRTRLAKLADDPALAAALGNHFAGASGPFDVQRAELSIGHRHAVLALLAGKAASDARPAVAIVDPGGAVAWTKERPHAGILPPVSSLAIAGGPRGRVALAACDPPTRSVALRLWDGDGSPFADFQVLDVDSCEQVTLLYWPRRGWVVVAAGVDVTRARLVAESGSLAWGRGLDVGVRSPAGAISPAGLGVDTDETFVLVQAVQPTKVPGSPFHLLAFRYDREGSAIWPAAVDLGELAKAPAPGERPVVTRLPPAGVEVALGELDLELRPSGSVNRKRRAPP